jgi:nicotinamide phosphoribosyltransferase
MKKIKEKRIRKIKKTVTNELNGIRYLLSKYPSGILSMVSDTFDIWRMCTEYLPILKEEILARDGKLVIRPDSGDPVDILCGKIVWVNKGEFDFNKSRISGLNPDDKGVIELLWDVFGGTINAQGYKVLDPHIGAIYGDSITIDRANEICKRLEAKGFASTNVVLGVGSFTYQYNTRDTFGFAMKATYVEVTHKAESGSPAFSVEGREIFKDPITDDGTKKSATGLLCVEDLPDGTIGLYDRVSWATEDSGILQTIYRDGEFFNQITLSQIRETLSKQIGKTLQKV